MIQAQSSIPGAPAMVRLAIIDFQPNWPEIVRSYLKDAGEDQASVIGADFFIEFFTPDTFPLQDSAILKAFDLVLANIQDGNLRFGSQLLACFQNVKSQEKVVFASEYTTSPHLVALAGKTTSKRLLEKPAMNKDFREMFKRLYALHLINML